MNKHPRNQSDHFWCDERRLIDLLVDGELGDFERQELLNRLDNTPEGWRRCALAFLESQTWRQAIGIETSSVVPGPASATRTALATFALNEKGRQGWRPTVRSMLALAATFLMAFALGFAIRPS